MLDFNKIVKILSKKWWKVMFKNEIYEILDPEKKEKYLLKLNNYLYRLKSLWIIVNLKSWIYIIPNEDDKKLNKIDLIDKYYLKLLKKYINYYVSSEYYISWRKSLELHMKNHEIPEKIFIVNRCLNKKIFIWNLEIIFKTISWKDFLWKKINLFWKFKKFTVNKIIDDISFKISNLELSLVETSLVNDTELWIPTELLSKTIKKYSKVFNIDIFYKIGKYKYILWFNRLKEISKSLDKNLYNIFLDIIKKNWNCFVWEWLRKM